MNQNIVKIGIAALVLVIVIVIIVVLTKKDNYAYPTGTLYVQPSDATWGQKSGNGGQAITQTYTTALVADNSGNISVSPAVPVGGIIMYSGTISAMPNGWGLCNGSTYQGANGTSIQSPDLTGRFVVGAGTSSTVNQLATQYNVGDTGGEEYHQLSVEELPSHDHSTRLGNGYCTGSSCASQFGGASYGGGAVSTFAAGGDPNNKDTTGNPLTLPHNNMPPYYALAYIIKYL
jgi:microcystin-dependent protein